MTEKELFLKLDDILLNSNKPSIEILELIKKKEFDKKPFIKIKKIRRYL